MNDLFQFLTSHLMTIGSLSAIVLLGVLFYVSVKRGLAMLKGRGVADPIIRVLTLFLRWTVVSLVLLLILHQLGVLQNVWSALLAVMAMIAVGFVAVWSILSNVLSTLLILMYRPFRIGDTIDIPSDNLSGQVEDLNLMFTTLKSDDGRFIQIPNNTFFQKPIRRQPGENPVGLYEQLTKDTSKE